MFLVRCISLFAACLLPTTNARPATAPENPVLSGFLHTVGNLTGIFDLPELKNIELTDQNVYVQFTNFNDDFFGFKAAQYGLGAAKKEIQKAIGTYGPVQAYGRYRHGETYFWLEFFSFPPASPKGLTGVVILGIIEQMIGQIESSQAYAYAVSRFDIFEGTAKAKGLLLGHGAINRVKPKDWNEPYQ